MSIKDAATDFLKTASAGQVDEAYAKYIHPEFIHHNPYFKGDRESLLDEMKKHVQQFPDKTYETIHALEDGELATVHGKVSFGNEKTYAVIHIFRFEDDKIIESWEASQEVLNDSPNKNGQF